MQWDFKYTFNCKFTKESSSKKFCKSVKIWQNYGFEFVASFFGPPCRYLSILCLWCIQLLLKSEHELIETVKSTNWPNALPMAMTSMTPIIGSINAPNPTCYNSIQPSDLLLASDNKRLQSSEYACVHSGTTRKRNRSHQYSNNCKMAARK